VIILSSFFTRKLNPHVDVLGRQIALEIRPKATTEQWDNYFTFAFVPNPRHLQSAKSNEEQR
jgi:hypothetical protein